MYHVSCVMYHVSSSTWPSFDVASEMDHPVG